jgi:hypothetical protein
MPWFSMVYLQKTPPAPCGKRSACAVKQLSAAEFQSGTEMKKAMDGLNLRKYKNYGKLKYFLWVLRTNVKFPPSLHGHPGW